MCLPDLIEIKRTPSPRKNRNHIRPVHKVDDHAPRTSSSPPPCIITIEPRSPRPSNQSTRSPGKGSIHVRGQVSPKEVMVEFSRTAEEQSNNRRQPSQEPVIIPRSPRQTQTSCESHSRRRRSNSSSSSSSSSSTISVRAFRALGQQIEALIKRITNVERELQADRARANQNLYTATKRSEGIEKEVKGLKDVVGEMEKKIQALY
ncbi:MAG: hypothetical protein Q9218_003828, partial [Villophora microphyllina]